MGAVSAICCENDKDSKKHEQPIPKHHPKPKVEHQPKSKPIEEKPPQPTQPNSLDNPSIDQKQSSEYSEETRLKLEEKQSSKEKVTLQWQNFQISHLIGEGGFGQVFLGELLDNKAKGIQEKYAIKRILKERIINKKLAASIKLQKEILHKSKWNFITTLHYAFRDEVYLYLVMEWAEGGDTYSLIKQKSNRFKEFKKAGEAAVRFVIACLIFGMEYLHSKNIIYRDLKPENLLIFENGYAKLTDFGLAKEIKENQQNRTEAGTTFYYAPEMVLRQNYGKEIDLWAIGIFAYEMSNYNPPFSGPEIKDKLRVKRLVQFAETNRNWKNPNLSQQLKDFINALLKFDPKERLGVKSWDDIKNHKFFTSVNFDWKALEEMKMPSPLKPIIDTFKCKYKQYIPQKKKKSTEINPKAQKDLQGWTCKNNDQV